MSKEQNVISEWKKSVYKSEHKLKYYATKW